MYQDDLLFQTAVHLRRKFQFLEHHLKPIMQKRWSYIKDTEDFLKKVQNMGKIPQDSILVTADVVGLYPGILHNAGLKALKDALDCRQNKKIPADMLVKMAEFVLTNNYFEFGKKYIWDGYWHEVCTTLCVHFYG